jgi:hypothetical protein
MKKKILVCIQNPYAIDNLIETLRSISDVSEITLVTSNYAIDENAKKKYLDFKKNLNLKEFFFIPFYNDGLSRSFKSIIKTHLYLKRLDKKIEFKEFDFCISDSRFFIWQRIILDKFLSTKCKLIGLSIDGIGIPLDKFNDLINGANPMGVVHSLHKLREPSKRKKNPSYIKRIINSYLRFKDVFFDRTLLSYLFYNQKFGYEKFDLNIFETRKFDYKICFFYSSYYFWEKLYDKNKVFWSSLEPTCKCEGIELKNKALFISTMWDEYGSKDQIIDNLGKTLNSFKNLKLKYPNLKDFDFKFHPSESETNINFIKKEVQKQNLVKINFIENNVSLQQIACNYLCVIGVMSGALLYLQSFCKNLRVYCLKSLSEKIAGEFFYLKLINENIEIYNELNNSFSRNEMKFDNEKTGRYNFKDILLSIINDSTSKFQNN